MKTEIVNLAPAEADALSKSVGFVICNLGQTRGMTYEQAQKLAASLAANGGSDWGIFKLCAVAHGVLKAEVNGHG